MTRITRKRRSVEIKSLILATYCWRWCRILRINRRTCILCIILIAITYTIFICGTCALITSFVAAFTCLRPYIRIIIFAAATIGLRYQCKSLDTLSTFSFARSSTLGTLILALKAGLHRYRRIGVRHATYLTDYRSFGLALNAISRFGTDTTYTRICANLAVTSSHISIIINII
jgi:hypothetical protein